tara:strand:- start:4245 stop:4907 length:663 start_codon:yes stop_codon:yes gene_type:complete
MNEIVKNNFFNNFKDLVLKNIKNIVIIFFIFLITFISYQVYSYYKIKNIKNTSIEFFNLINNQDINSEIFNELKKNDNIFSTLTALKQIQISNENKNFSVSNEIYKEVLLNESLGKLYSSSIAAHASYTLINASYEENTKDYINDISLFIDNISDDLENYISLKKELTYLLEVTETDLNKTNYSKNSELIDLYNEIQNSDIISSSVKERVKKIHEFHLYQ